MQLTKPLVQMDPSAAPRRWALSTRPPLPPKDGQAPARGAAPPKASMKSSCKETTVRCDTDGRRPGQAGDRPLRA